jgi:superfamily II DNA/RNA helicase
MENENNSKKECYVFENYETNVELQYYDKFENLGLRDDILRSIFSFGFERPSPIQRIAIKPIIDGNDCVIQSHSGSGKTATFIISALQIIDVSLKAPQIIIISNTRELAEQHQRVFKALADYSNMSSYLCIGGDMSNKYMAGNIHNEVIIGTPGRIGDMIKRKYIDPTNIKMVIIDEADEVLSSGFQKQVSMIFRSIQSMNENYQTVLISATIPQEMTDLIQYILKKKYVSILVKDDDLTLDGIKQYYADIGENYKMNALMDVLNNVRISQGVIYCNKKQKADEIKRQLVENNFKCDVLHSDLMPKDRKSVLNDFIHGHTRILVTTDVMARGIDVQQISVVVNYDMPKHPQTYIHRIGRSGRFGRQGLAINFVAHNEMNILSNIQKTYNTHVLYLPENLQQLNV